MTKIIKLEKDYSYQVRLQKLRLTNLQERSVRGDLTETLKMINGMSNYCRRLFNNLLELEIYCQD